MVFHLLNENKIFTLVSSLAVSRSLVPRFIKNYLYLKVKIEVFRKVWPNRLYGAAYEDGISAQDLDGCLVLK